MYSTTMPHAWNSNPGYSHSPSPPYFADAGFISFDDQSSAWENPAGSFPAEFAFQDNGMHQYTSAAPVPGRAIDSGLTAQQKPDPPALGHYGFVDNTYCHLGSFDPPHNGLRLYPPLRGECPSNASAVPSGPAGNFKNMPHAIRGCNAQVSYFMPNMNDIWNPPVQQAASNVSSDMCDDFSDSNLSGEQPDLQGSNSYSSIMTTDDSTHLEDVGSTVQQLLSIVSGFRKNGDHSEINRLKLELIEKDLIIKKLHLNQRKNEQSKISNRNSSKTTTYDHHPSPSEKRAQENSNKVAKVRRAFDKQEREGTARTRKIGACMRCRRRKERCKPLPTDPFGRCVSCALTIQISNLPCIRTRIPQVWLHRIGTTANDTWTKRDEIQRDVTELSNIIEPHEIKMLKLTHGFSATLVISVAEFDPKPGDVTCYEWAKSRKSRLEMPPFAITKIKDAQRAVRIYLEENLPSYVKFYLEKASQIALDTFQVAMDKALLEENDFIKSALHLWMATRLIEEPWRMDGSETLGVGLEDTSGTPYEGVIPIPPVMDSQFDQIVIQKILNPLREQVLDALDKRISAYKSEEWFETFMVMFILLNNIEIATAHDHGFAQFHGHVTPCRGSRFEDYNLIEGYFHSAQTLIAHFRDIINGHAPFSKDWNHTQAESLGILGHKETAYLDRLTKTIVGMKGKMVSLRTDHKYESILYWCHQLFYPDWDSSQVRIKELPEVGNEADGVKS